MLKIGHERRYKSYLKGPCSMKVLTYSRLRGLSGFSTGRYINCMVELRYADDTPSARQDSGGIEPYEKPNSLWNVVVLLCLSVSESCASVVGVGPPASFAAEAKASRRISSWIGLLLDWAG